MGDERGSRRAVLFAACLAIFSGACLFRVVIFNGFSNDQFVLAAAQAIGAGDWPVRDYTEGGAPLQELLSALAQVLFGPGLFAELILTVAAIGLAAAVTCWAAARLTGSIVLGLVAGALQVIVFPLLYGFPKILIYPVLFLIGWGYLRRPSLGRLAGLGVWTAFAFLLRHDHGVYSAIGSVAAVVLAHWPDGVRTIVRRSAAYAVIVACGIAPYLAYVDRYLGIVEYFQTGIAISRTQASNEDWNWPRLEPVRGGAPLVIRPRPAEHLAPIAVRWREGLSVVERQEHERALGLLFPELRDDGRSWRYRVELPAIETMRTLIESPDVADTAGFDRRTLELADPPTGLTILVIALALDRVTWGPPLADLLTKPNATAIVWYAVWFLLPITPLIWILRRRPAGTPPASGPEVLLLVAIAVPTMVGFVRAPTVTRIPDAFGTVPIVTAWVVAALWAARPRPAVLQVPLKLLALGLPIALALTVGVMADLPARLRGALPGGPGTVAARVRTVIDETRTWPWAMEPRESVRTQLVRYVNRCTTSDDRLLVTWYAPELNFQSRRLFAGGEITLASPQRPPDTYEARVLERLRRQSVPVVLSLREDQPRFDAAYPRIAAYLAERYRTAGAVTEEDAEYSVLVDTRLRPGGTDPQLHLPCFARRSPLT